MVNTVHRGRSAHDARIQLHPSSPLWMEYSFAGLITGNYPAIHAAKAKKRSAEAGVELARTAYLPRADFLWQENVATRNNVFRTSRASTSRRRSSDEAAARCSTDDSITEEVLSRQDELGDRHDNQLSGLRHLQPARRPRGRSEQRDGGAGRLREV